MRSHHINEYRDSPATLGKSNGRSDGESDGESDGKALNNKWTNHHTSFYADNHLKYFQL
jgi:hypothetical protein